MIIILRRYNTRSRKKSAVAWSARLIHPVFYPDMLCCSVPGIDTRSGEFVPEVIQKKLSPVIHLV